MRCTIHYPERGDLARISFAVGAKGTATLMVGHEHLASIFKDALLPPVFATPMMVRLMENAALNAIRSHFGPGESSVGTAIMLHHLAATPESMRVRAEAKVTAVDGRRIPSPSPPMTRSR